MNNNSNLLINEEELKEPERIELYKELIRILEKDIDDARNRNAREGWNTWGILGAIGAAVFILLGQTKDLQQIPAETINVSITSILLFQFIFGAYNYLNGSKNLVKERRLIDSKEVFKGRKSQLIIRFLVLLAVSFGIYFSDYSLAIKIISVILIFIPILYMSLSLFLGSRVQIFVGNTPQHQKAGSIASYSVVGFYLAAIILLGYQLQFPIGQSLSAAYVIGLSISAIIFLTEVLLSNSTSTDFIADLQDLKDDIIFRRKSLDEGLSKYQILKEGKSLFDEMKPDFDRIMNYLYREEEIYNEQRKILNKIIENLPSKDDAEELLEDKKEQVSIYLKSFETYTREMNSLISLATSELNPFYQKLQKAAAASGDYEWEDAIKRMLSQKLNDLVEAEKEINAKRNNLAEQANRLELESSND